MAALFWARVDRLMRSLHLYAGLFLTPWILVYATSALFLNHNEWVRNAFGVVPPTWEVVREIPFTPDDAFPVSPEGRAAAVLEVADLLGPHRIQGKPTPREMTIFRFCGAGNYRVAWRGNQSKIIVEQQRPFSPVRLLHFLHFRGGYGQPYPTFVLWAIMVDVVSLSMWLWVASGIYLWARRPVRRKLGSVFLVAGCLVFAGLVVLLST